MRKKHSILLGVALLLYTLAGVAHAAPAGGQAFVDVINSFFSTSSSIAANSPFVEDGKMLMRYLLLILIAWTGIWSTLKGEGFAGGVAGLAKTIMIYGICSFMMLVSTQQSLVKGFDGLAQKAVAASGADFDVENPAQGILKVAQQGLKTVKTLWTGSEETEATGAEGGATAEGSSNSHPWLKALVTEGPWDVFLGLLMSNIMKLAISLIVLLCYAIFIVVMSMSQVLINIGLLLAPLFIPWLLWDATSFLFHGWLKFTIVAGFQKVVGATIFGMTIQLLAAVESLSVAAGSNPVYDQWGYTAALLLSVLAMLAMSQVPSIAAGLVSGLPSTSLPSMRRPQAPKSGGGKSPSNPGNPGGGGGGGGKPSTPEKPPSPPQK